MHLVTFLFQWPTWRTFYIFIYFISLHVSSIMVLIIRRSNCINTSSSMISLCDCLVCRSGDRHTKQSLTQTNPNSPCVALTSSRQSLSVIPVLVNNHPDAPFYIFIYFTSLHVSSITVLIIRRSNCINTSSAMISLCKWLLGMPVRRELQFPSDRHTKL